jgi:hypothetical protein
VGEEERRDIDIHDQKTYFTRNEDGGVFWRPCTCTETGPLFRELWHDYNRYREACVEPSRLYIICQSERSEVHRGIKESRDYYCRTVHRLRKPDYERPSRTRAARYEKRALIKSVQADHERETKELQTQEQALAVDSAVHADNVDVFRRTAAESLALFECMELLHAGLHGSQRSAEMSRWLSVVERRKMAYARNELCRRQQSALDYDIQLVF